MLFARQRFFGHQPVNVPFIPTFRRGPVLPIAQFSTPSGKPLPERPLKSSLAVVCNCGKRMKNFSAQEVFDGVTWSCGPNC